MTTERYKRYKELQMDERLLADRKIYTKLNFIPTLQHIKH